MTDIYQNELLLANKAYVEISVLNLAIDELFNEFDSLPFDENNADLKLTLEKLKYPFFKAVNESTIPISVLETEIRKTTIKRKLTIQKALTATQFAMSLYELTKTLIEYHHNSG